MASIRKIEGKGGISYKITVSMGRDAQDKQIRHFKTWKPDRPMTARQMEKEVQRVALEFEQEITKGFQADNRQTFNEYAKYVIDLKERTGAALRTIEHYNWALERVSKAFGYMRLADIRPQHINAFYKKLSEPGERKLDTIAYPLVDFRSLVNQAGGVRKLGRELHINRHYITAVCRGESLTIKIASRIAGALGKSLEEAFRLEQHTEGTLSKSTILRHHSFISTVFSQAEKEMLITYNPAKRATPPPESRDHQPNYFQPEQMQRILEAADREPIRNRTMIYLFAVTGARRGEIMALSWDKIDFQNRQIKIDQCLTYGPSYGIRIGPTKTKNTRYITIPDEMVQLLRQYSTWWSEQKLLRGWPDTSLLFVKEDGGAQEPGNVNVMLAAFSKKYGLPHINPHAFRHTAASVLISEGVDVVTVSKMLGHANTSMTTDIYSHVIEESKRKATECIADVMLRKKKA